MDWSPFGMERAPFRPTVDTSAYYAAPAHEAALQTLAAAFARRDAAVLIDGPPGVGKSLVARKWLDDLISDVPRVFLTNVRAERPDELLQAILFDLEQPYQGLTEQELRLAVTGQLLDAAAGGFPTVLVIDEAQYLSLAVLEELRLIGNLESCHGTVVFVVLIAQPTLREALHQASHALVADRIAARCTIEPLSVENAMEYIHHQVRAAGGNPNAVFDGEAVSLLATACGGRPRTLNQATTLAFELAAAGQMTVVDEEAALNALAQLGLDPLEDRTGEQPVLLLHPAQAEESTRAVKKKLTGLDERPPARGPKEKATRKRSA